jgi:hypothetical protein
MKQKINVKSTAVKEQVKEKVNEIKNQKTKQQNKKEEVDSSDISSYDENENYENMTNDEISQKGKEKFFKTELMEKIIKYIKIDDSIKDKQKEVRDQMKVLKTQKEEMEKYIISYLETINEEYVKIGESAKLTRTVSQTKGAIKQDNIKVSIFDQLKKENMVDDKINELLENIVDNIEKNRPVKTKTYIKRTKAKEKKDVNKSIRDIATSNKKGAKQHVNNSDEEDDDIPKYSSNN